MQRHTGNHQPITPLFEFRRPIPCPHGAEIRKQRLRCRTPFQKGFNLRAEPEQRRLEVCAARFQFLAGKANRAFIPINVFRQQAGPVRLRRAGCATAVRKSPGARCSAPAGRWPRVLSP